MENFKITGVLLLLITCYSCRNAEKKVFIHPKAIQDLSEINIKIDFDSVKTDEYVYLSYLNQLSDKKTFDIDKGSKASQHLKIKSDVPVFVLDWSPNQVYYVFYPRETISIEPSTSTKEMLSVRSSIRDSTRMNEIEFFEKLNLNELTAKSKKLNESLNKVYSHDRTGRSNARIQVLIELIKSKKLKDPKLSVDFITSRYSERLQYLEEYSASKKISGRYKAIIRNFLEYEFNANLLEILNNARGKKIQVNDDISSKGTSIVSHLNCDSCLFIPTYQYTVKNYLKFAFERNNLQTLKEKREYINSVLEGGTKDFALFLILKSARNLTRIEDKKIKQEFILQNTTNEYASYLRADDTFFLNLEKLEDKKSTILSTKEGRRINTNDLLKKLRGNVILIDFWASWCIPCKKQMPYSKLLQKKFKDANISFVYLSLDKSVVEWSESAKSLGLVENSYIVDGEFSSLLAKKFEITSIPRYILIDKYGKVADMQAPGPRDPLLNQAIKKLITQ